jgi:hypothetical protein
MTERCPIEPGTRVRVVSGPFVALADVATVARVQRAAPEGPPALGPKWLLTCTVCGGRRTVPLLIDEVEVVR